ncbi:MAG: hypothetical protein DCC69_14165 [Hyphomicrobiales bacterium]|nr:MAG: hypothetical protein DCC69_14165 [Hyphomicrobiales bacterium]
MKLERDADGDYVLDPALLTQRLSVPEDELRHLMRLGQVTSVVEAGEGDDAGRQRLSVRCGDMVWRAVVDAQLNVLSEESFDLRYRRWRSPG